MVLATMCGLTLADFEVMTIGMIFDFIDQYIEMKCGKDEEQREATQQDFDSF